MKNFIEIIKIRKKKSCSFYIVYKSPRFPSVCRKLYKDFEDVSTHSWEIEVFMSEIAKIICKLSRNYHTQILLRKFIIAQLRVEWSLKSLKLSVCFKLHIISMYRSNVQYFAVFKICYTLHIQIHTDTPHTDMLLNTLKWLPFCNF